MKKTLVLLLSLLLLALPLGALGETVATSFYPIYVFALNLTQGIDGLEVHNLAAPDTGCLHDYQLQTGDMKALAQADVFLINGAGMESYLQNVLDAFPDLPVVDASAGIPLLEENGELHEHDEAEDEDHDHQVNAHLWLDAANALAMVDNLSAGLCEAFPAYAQAIEANRTAYAQRLTALDAELRTGLADLPRKDIITFHEAFPYFARAYGLNVVGVVNREPGDALSPAQLAELVGVVENLGTPPLFVEPQYDDMAARTLAQETGAEVYTLDPVVTGPTDETALTRYEDVMRENMRTLQQALGA